MAAREFFSDLAMGIVRNAAGLEKGGTHGAAHLLPYLDALWAPDGPHYDTSRPEPGVFG